MAALWQLQNQILKCTHKVLLYNLYHDSPRYLSTNDYVYCETERSPTFEKALKKPQSRVKSQSVNEPLSNFVRHFIVFEKALFYIPAATILVR